MSNYGLNDEQLIAIKAASPSYLNASAGSGKTRCLTEKIHLLMDQGAPLSSILSITFTNKAANEMKERLKKFCKVTDMQISTIHSMSVRIIRKFIAHTYLKYPFTIYDDSDQMSLVKSIVKSLEIAGDPYEYKGAIGKFKSEGILPDQVKEIPVDEAGQPLSNFLRIYKQYQEILKQNNACDFDDLLILARTCLSHDDCKKYYSSLWKHILVDEFQDTSGIQYDIIMSIYDPSVTKTLFMVGDKNQGVYSWRGARPENVDKYIKDYKANVNYLTYNYRSCSEVINHANKFLQYGKPMVPKASVSGKISVAIFPSLEEEAEQIAAAVRKLGNYNETAIIYRANTRSLFFEQAFARYRIPYKVVNELPFYQRRVCKDLIAALSAANNPDDRASLARVINNPKRGFGDVKKVKLMEQGLPYLENIKDDVPLIKSFMELMKDIKGMPPARALTEYLNRSGYWTTIEKESDRFMIQAFQDVVVTFESVEELVLASSFLERDSGEGVNLITAHGSKGLEYKQVFVVGVENGLWPHKNAADLEEEARLFYVAVTRAKEFLNVSYSKTRSFRGTIMENVPSPFFKDTYQHIYGKPLIER